MEVDEPQCPPFDPLSYRVSFGGFSIDKDDFQLEKELPLLGRDELLEVINTQSTERQQKYMPFIISTSRGMGKTFLLQKIGAQDVPKGLENPRIREAAKRGRILSFDFAAKAADAPKTVNAVRRFPVHLMIFSLCNLFGGAQVDGIHFEKMVFLSHVATYKGTQRKFNGWLSKCLALSTSDMILEYTRLTNIAFQDTESECSEPPVSLFDEVQAVCEETDVMSTLPGRVARHTLLTLLLTELSVSMQPICICTGTNDGGILNITAKSSINPLVLSLTPFIKEAEYTTFWKEVTRFRNKKGGHCIDLCDSFGKIIDENLFLSLVYASYQVPRLLYLAHEQWYRFKMSGKTNREKVLLDFEESAQRYYSEMAQIWQKYSPDDIAHIALSCGVHFHVNLEFDRFVPGTSITWKSLIDEALIFPYLDHCFVFPFQLIWNAAAKTITSENEFVPKRRNEAIKKCRELVNNLDVELLYAPYDMLCTLQPYDLGIWFESFFVLSLAVKYYLHATVTKSAGPYSFAHIYDIGGAESERARAMLSPYMVDFKDGISLPDEEAFVNNTSFETSIIHNKKINKAHHDIIIPAMKEGTREDIAVQAKASFRLVEAADRNSPTQDSRQETQLSDCRSLRHCQDQGTHSKELLEINSQTCISKTTDERVALLIWLYLDSSGKEKKHEDKPIVFLNASGCCNGLTLDIFILLKRLRSTKMDRK